MAFIAGAILGAIGAGASIFGGYEQSQATKAASQNILQGQQQAIGAINKLETPFVNFSQGLQPTLQSLLTPGPSQTQTLSQLPGFQFAKDIVTEGVSAGAGRTGISGTTATAGGTLASNIAASNWTQFLNPLLSAYSTGAQSAGNAGSQISNTITGGSQNLAQLNVGQGNILAGAAGGVGNNLSNALLFNALRGGNRPNGSFGSDNNNPTQIGSLY